MCGINGIINLKNQLNISQKIIENMNNCINHRGPDDSGIYISEQIGLGSTRLSILDLSINGHMPMVSENKRYWIVYNGEIFNFKELKNDLEGKSISFKSTSDTEVLLKLYEIYGKMMLDKLNGMFAFAIWDTLEKELFIARDRMGVKPFYYTIHNNQFIFSSEPKAIFCANVPKSFDESSWEEILVFRFISGEKTPYKNILRLLPGHSISIKNGKINIIKWWKFYEQTQENRFTENKNDIIEHFEELFVDSLKLRKISDVPIGILLSGGLDSGSTAAVLTEQTGKGMESYTVRFKENGYDEGDLAKEVANKFGMKYNELFIEENELLKFLKEATFYLDEPIVHGHDPHLLAISRYAKPRVSVLMSGEGADEILGGYVRYRFFRKPFTSELFETGLKSILPIFKYSNRMRKAFNIYNMDTLSERIMYSSADVFPDKFRKIDDFKKYFPYRSEIIEKARNFCKEPVRQVMYYEQNTYLQSLLDRNDKITMGASIECREPYLDYRIIEWISGIPTKNLFYHNIGKAILRKSMKKRLPSNILKHKKWGFGVPWHNYLRNYSTLKTYINNMSENDIFKSCPINPQEIQTMVKQFNDGDNTVLPLIRILFFVSLWNDVCVNQDNDTLINS
jgi:asparagine synthase (glutamine-hydrolysing)